MATTNQIKFYKGQSQPTTATVGAIWFCTTDRAIRVYTGSDWEKYAGLVNASWSDTDKKLTITDAAGATTVLNLSDMASASGVAAQINTINTNVTNAQNAANAAQADVDAVEGIIGSGFENAEGKTVADQLAAVKATADAAAVKATVDAELAKKADATQVATDIDTAKQAAITAAAADATTKANTAESNAKGYADGLNTTMDGRVAALEAAVGGDGSVSDMVDGKIETALDALDFNETKGSTVTVQVVQENGKITTLAVDDSKAATAQALTDEIGRATAAEEALAGRMTTAEGEIDTLQGQVAALSSATHFLGVKDSLDDVTAPAAGDIVIVGDKEYVYDDTKGWVELGDVTAEQTRLNQLESWKTEASQDIADLDAEIDAVAKDLADNYATDEELQALANGAVKTNTEKIAEIEGEVDQNTAAVANYKTRIEALEGTANALGSTYVKVSDYTTDKAAFEQKHENLQGEIDAAEGRLDTAEADIDGAQKDIANLQAGTGLVDGTNAPVYTNANYISGATTMVAADMALDAKIKEVADSVTNKNVTAEGDTYVSATAANNKVTVAAVTGTVESKSGLATNQGVYDALCWVEFN